ncbi:MAG: hypothetical protein V1755_14525 [Chloroflexota bacterium]
MKSTTTAVVAAALILTAVTLACGALVPEAPSASAPAEATVDLGATPADTAEAAAPPEPTATSDPCIPWDQVTVAMKGEVACMRGVITKFSSSGQASTRYSFSDKSGTFFLFSAKYEITNPNTGKTIAPGTCVEVTGPVDVQSDTPYINLDKIIDNVGDEVQGFLFYDDPAACG